MTRTMSLAAALVGLVGLLAVGVALATSTKTVSTYKATLTRGAEVPKPTASASAKGAFTASVTTNAGVRTLRWKLTFSGLSGKAVAAHIHKGKVGVAGAVLVGLCGPCASGGTGVAKISKGAADALAKGTAYVNVHTAKNAGGETRGQVKLIKTTGAPTTTPDPTTTTPGTGGGYGGVPTDPGAGY